MIRLLFTLLLSALLASCASNNVGDSPVKVGNPKYSGGGNFRSAAIAEPTTPKSVADLDEAARLNVQLGANYLNKGDLKQAKAKLERALKQDPEFAQAHWVYALLQQRLGDNPGAETHYRKALALDPKDPFARNNFGVFLCTERRMDEALEQFKLAYSDPLYETPEAALTNAGLCQAKNGGKDDAENHFRAALNKRPKYPAALYELAKLNHERGQSLPAQVFLQRLFSAGGEDAQALWLAVKVEQDLGNAERAEQYAQSLAKKYPDSIETGEYLRSQSSVK